MLRNKNGSTFVPVPHQPTTANKCEYVFLTGYAAYPSGVTLGAFLFEDEAASFLAGITAMVTSAAAAQAMTLGHHMIETDL